MKDAQKANQITLANLIGELRAGRFVIPDFQREFEWEPADIRALMRSVFLDYYIGNLLLWRGTRSNFDNLACETIYGYDGDDNNRNYIVLDGQQRLTALYYALVGPDHPAPRRRNRFLYFIRADRFMNETYDDAFPYYWTSHAIRLLDDHQAQYAQHMFPLSVVGKPGWELPNWAQGYVQHWEREADRRRDAGETEAALAADAHAVNARAFGEHLQDITQRYQISYIELDRDLEIDKVCDIFTQINSRGVRLDVFDLMNALLKPKGITLKHLWRRAQPRFDLLQASRMNVYVLQVMSILAQNYCSPKYLYYLIPGQERRMRRLTGLHTKVLVRDTAHFEELWQRSVAALEEAVDLLRHPREYGAVAPRFFPYVAILPAFAALQSTAKLLPANIRLSAQWKIRCWYWASVFMNRYSGAVESTTARDYLNIRAWFNDDDKEPGLIDEFKSQVRRLDLRGWTKPGSSIYNGTVCLLVLQGARDWVTGIAVRSKDVDDHHIVPKSWGKENGIDSAIDSVLNRTPLSADANRKVIRDRLPNQYLPELFESNGEEEARRVLQSHLVTPQAVDILMRDPFGPEDFDEFLDARQQALREAIGNLLVKDQMELAPHDRESDERIERIELSLRELINAELNGSRAELPPHAKAKIDERLDAAVRRNPTIEAEYQPLIRYLEYADFRDLQQVILSKALWTRFSDRLAASKAMVERRFDQVAELRNGIRHSRAVHDIVRREGEAAVIWFENVLRLTDAPRPR